jgi:hypothetical protein
MNESVGGDEYWVYSVSVVTSPKTSDGEAVANVIKTLCERREVPGEGSSKAGFWRLGRRMPGRL